MSEYTPTPNEIRADFITLHTRNFDSYTVGRSLTSEQEVYGDAFDRMIASVERAAAARALEEFADQMTTGFNAGTLNAERRAIKREARARAEAYRQEREEQ